MFTQLKMLKIDTLTLNEKNITDFAAARNRLLKSAKTGWVLFIDTDETLSGQLKNEIEKLDPKDFNGFFIKRKIIFLGKEIGEDKVLRLGKVGKGIWKRKVHETWHIKGKVGTLKNFLIHNTAGNIHSYIEKMNNYSDLHAKENMNEGKRSNLFKIIVYPKAKLIVNLLQGRGFTFSILQSFHSFLGWVKLWELQRK